MKLVEDFEFSSITTPFLTGKINEQISQIKKRGLEGIIASTSGKGILIGNEIKKLVQNHVKDPQIAALEDFIRIQEKVALRQYETVRPCIIEPTAGIRIKQNVKAISDMAVIAPGSWETENPYALTSILTAAAVAGVSRRYVFLSPDRNGGISPLSIYAADLAGATEIYRMTELQALVCLTEGYLFKTPEQIISLSTERTTKAAALNFKRKLKKKELELVIMGDSKSAPDKLFEMIVSWYNDEPLSECYFISTSKRLVSKLQSKIREYANNPPPWWNNLKTLQTKIVHSNEEAMEYLSNFSVKYLVLPSAKTTQIIDSIDFAEHIIKGDTASPVISKRITSAAVIRPQNFRLSNEPGITDFLKTVIYEEISTKTGERLKKGIQHIRSDIF